MKYTRLAIVAILFVGLIFWLRLRSMPDASVPAAIPNKPMTIVQVANPALATVDPAKPSAPSPADLPNGFDPRIKMAKDEIRPQIDEMVNFQLENITPEDSQYIYGVNESILLEYKSIQQTTPTLNEAGDIATYSVDDATWAKIKSILRAARAPEPEDIGQEAMFQKAFFRKVGDDWIECESDGEPFPDPSKAN